MAAHTLPKQQCQGFIASTWRKRAITAVLGLCFCILLIEGNFTPRQIRNQTQTPAIMMLAAIPHRRMRGENSTRATGADTVYPAAVQQNVGGFTLIELSIVLVVIGLIVGGILVGRDLISAAQVRAQISQIEKYQQAVNTFKGKYGALPGDIPDPDATNFGFKARGQYAGEGDGNGILEGINANAPGQNSGVYQFGETQMFWVDLSTAKLLDSFFNTATSAGTTPSYINTASNPNIAAFFPKAAIGNGNYIFVFSGTWASVGGNYFSISSNPCIGICGSGGGMMSSYAGLTVSQASAMDSKIDDGLPQSGRVVAAGIFGGIKWASSDMYMNPGASTGYPLFNPTTAATPGSSGTCYDNNNVGGNPQQYSLTQNNGTGINCAVSFKFQ